MDSKWSLWISEIIESANSKQTHGYCTDKRLIKIHSTEKQQSQMILPKGSCVKQPHSTKPAFLRNQNLQYDHAKLNSAKRLQLNQ
jgi:hypothetical protein